jgi:hypothetical protein
LVVAGNFFPVLRLENDNIIQKMTILFLFRRENGENANWGPQNDS